MKEYEHLDAGQMPNATFRERQRRTLYARGHCTIISLFVLAIAFFWFMRPDQVSDRGYTTSDHFENGSSAQMPFSWSEIVPSSTLEYHECFDGFQCARLELPMDYHRADGLGRRVTIAITRLPAKVPVTDPRYGGAVLINPGGPGGSGVEQVLVTGRNLQTIVDAENDPSSEEYKDGDSLYFDIVGFDPRGVNNTTPQFSCFPSLASHLNFGLQAEAEGMLGSSSDSLMRNWQRTAAISQTCSEALLIRNENDVYGEALGEHMNTLPVARDMIEIIERHAEWREKQGLKQQEIEDQAKGYDNQQKIATRTQWKYGQEKLLYWGRSYGTVVGGTFATLYPDRIARAVLDGVVDLDDYYNGGGESSITDADAIFERFFEYCDAAGPDQCPFYVPGGPSEIKSSYYALEAEIRDKSVPVPASGTRGPEVITWTDLKIVQRISVYQPILTFPLLASFLADLKKGDGSSMAAFKQRNRRVPCLSEECVNAGLWSQQCTGPGISEDASNRAILCSDARYLTTISQDEFKVVWDGLVADSKTIGDYWAGVYMMCAGWKPQAQWRREGLYGGNTSYPLLFVSTSLDPVTPLKAAKRMSSSFPDSIVLEQNSEGHTTGSGPSLCIAKAIRNYFQSGRLPEPNTICSSDLTPFLDAPKNSSIELASMTLSDRRLYDAMIDDMSSFAYAKSLTPAYADAWKAGNQG